MDKGYDFCYECVVSDDVLWILYCKGKEVVQDAPKIVKDRENSCLRKLIDNLTHNQRLCIKTICDLTEIKGAAISVGSILDNICSEDKRPQEESFGRNINTLSRTFKKAGQEIKFKYSNRYIISYIEKKKIISETDGSTSQNPPATSTEKSEEQKRKPEIRLFTPTLSDSNEKDEYYINAIKEAALLIYSEDALDSINKLQNVLFFKRQELSDRAKSKIDNFFAEEYVSEMIKRGLDRNLAEQYVQLWWRLVLRQQCMEEYEREKDNQDFERIEMLGERLYKRSYEVQSIIDKIDTYYNSIDNGGQIHL